jgi:hypothetical protein
MHPVYRVFEEVKDHGVQRRDAEYPEGTQSPLRNLRDLCVSALNSVPSLFLFN